MRKCWHCSWTRRRRWEGSASLTQATVKAFMSMTDPGGSTMFAQIGVMQDWIEPSSRSRTLIYEPVCHWPEIST